MNAVIRFAYGNAELYPRLYCYGRGGFDVCSEAPIYYHAALKVKRSFLYMIFELSDRLKFQADTEIFYEG